MKMKSLARSLFIRYVLVLLAVWSCLVAFALYDFVQTGEAQIHNDLQSGAQQLLAVMRVLADSPQRMASVAKEVESLDATRSEPSGSDLEIFFEVWLGQQRVYASAAIPDSEPPQNHLALETSFDEAGEKWRAVTAIDPATDTRTRVLMEDPRSVAFNVANIGFYILPLLVSFPFLLLPTWLVTRRSLRPLHAIGDELDARDETDLSALENTGTYREISPLVSAVNRLMSRLRERLDREKEFLSDAAHELKTPLAVIQSNAERLALGAGDTTNAAALSGIEVGLARATHAVHQLLAFSRVDVIISNPSFTVYNLSELIAEHLAALESLARGKEIELRLESPCALAFPIERNAFSAMIDNLLHNALTHSPVGTVVSVTVLEEPLHLSLMIDDQGPGIAAEQRERVFERFLRLPDSPRGGSGLGLAIAQRAVDLHGGTITLTDVPDSPGLRVRIELPRYH